MGTHYFQMQLQVGIPQVGAVAGRLLCLETTLYAPQGHRWTRAARVGERVRVQPRRGEVRLPVLLFLITNAQVQALEQRRTGDLRLELQVNASSRSPPRGSRAGPGHRVHHHRREQVAPAAGRARPHAGRGDGDPVPRR